jgi:hypothetical protein
MREACLILKNHLNDDVKTLKSKEVVSFSMPLIPLFDNILEILNFPYNFRLVFPQNAHNLSSVPSQY